MKRAISMVAAGATQREAARALGYSETYLSDVLTNSPAAKKFLEERVERARVRSRLLIERRLDRLVAREFPEFRKLLPGVKPSEASDRQVELTVFSPQMVKIAGYDVDSEWKGPPAPTPVQITIQSLPDDVLREMVGVIRKVRKMSSVPAEAKRLT